MTKVIASFVDREVDLEDMMSGIGEGWKPIVRDLVDALYDLEWEGRVAQIKEKFGGLRFYADGVPEGGRELIDEAERICSETCENCGNPGRLRGQGWVLTLCDECERVES